MLQITTSLNIAILDSKIVADVCNGLFRIDVSPSTFIGNGINNVLGVKVRVQNKIGVAIKDFTNSYDFSPTANTYTYGIPTQAGNYQYGRYTITVRLYDANGSYFDVVKTIKLCEPNPKNKTKKYGVISATMEAICTEAKARFRIDNPPTYNGIISDEQQNTFTLQYPTESGLAPVNFTVVSFSAALFEGEWRIFGNMCATYEDTDNISYKVPYKIDVTKTLRCSLDECCVFQKLSELHQVLNGSCTDQEREQVSSVTLDVLRLVKLAKLAAICGEDASDYITELEDLLQCRCSATPESTPLSLITPSKDFAIAGCNVQKETVGLTDFYTIDVYDYSVGIDPNGGALVISDLQVNGCTKTQQITFNISNVYAQIKNYAASTNNEALAWASIINKTLTSANGVVPSACFNITQQQWDVLTFPQKFSALLNALCACCGCNTGVIVDDEEKDGADVVISFHKSDNGVHSIRIYLDGVLVAIVLGDVTSFRFVGAADGITHNYVLEPVCSNNSLGIAHNDQFNFVGCPDISAPNVSTNNAANVDCPFDLTSLVSGLGVGITAEWHTANNTLPQSLVSDPTQVGQGSYFVFAKDANGCYSSGVNVIVTCAVLSSCTAPQAPNVVASVGGYLITFSSASFPPPANSYTVKRRLTSDPDVTGSYITVGTPVFDSSLNKWKIIDTTAVDNRLYVYRIFSNCGGTTPYVDFQFSNIGCPAIVLTPSSNSAGFSFAPLGGDVSKYEVRLYNSAGIAVLDLKTFTPAFPNPITDTFIGLASLTDYKVRVTVYIGSYSKQCAFVSFTTDTISELPCADVWAEAYPAEPQTGGHNVFGVRVHVDQPYDQDITVNGYILGNENILATLYTLIIPAGQTSAETGLIYVGSATEMADAFITAVFPEVVTAGGDSFSTQCDLSEGGGGGGFPDGQPVQVLVSEDQGDICFMTPIVIYTSTGNLGVGRHLFADIHMTIPLTGYNYISEGSGANIYHVDRDAAIILSATGNSC